MTKPQGAVAEKATPAVPKPQKVRVIVEFNKESILDYATEQKKTVAQLNQADVEKKLQSIKQEQDKVLKNIEKSVHFDSSKVKRYDAIINGVALDIQAQEIEKLKTIADVRRVYVSQEYVQTKPLLSSSGQLIGLPEVWNNSQYKGEGTVVAVIDSGVDFKHQALKIKEPNRAKYNKTSIEKLIHEKNLKGKFYSEKVPYGYNYYDYNDNLKDSYGVMHGMHVTGIVGANDDNQKLYGVAPNASKTIIGLAVDLGAGAPSELSKHFDLSGKIAMLEIPEDNKSNGFLEKVQAITKLNPAAILLYNNAKVKDDLGSQLLVESEAAKFNIARITRSTYNNIKNNSNKIITILTERQAIDNSLAGQLSSYSSWGPTPDLRLKPEITAPGGHIFSTVEDNQYADKSGTSMAAPQVAGAAAVLKQYITDKKIPVDNAADFIKLLLMNTAQPIINKQSKDGKTPYFVRQQGSGAMNLAKALVTTVVATVTGTNDNNADGKLELRELKEKKFKARILLRNFGKTNKTYIISSEAIADPVDEKGFRTQNSEHLVSKKLMQLQGKLL
ncbi:TPA: S8 family serine peptidase [Streptococcus agalactiae]